MDRKDLKVQALLERVSSLTTEYENKVADLRVELTVSEQSNAQLVEQVESLTKKVDKLSGENVPSEESESA